MQASLERSVMPTSREVDPVVRARVLHRGGAGEPAPSSGILENVPDDLRRQLPDDVVDELLAGARTEEEIVGPGGLLSQLTKCASASGALRGLTKRSSRCTRAGCRRAILRASARALRRLSGARSDLAGHRRGHRRRARVAVTAAGGRLPGRVPLDVVCPPVVDRRRAGGGAWSARRVGLYWRQRREQRGGS